MVVVDIKTFVPLIGRTQLHRKDIMFVLVNCSVLNKTS